MVRLMAGKVGSNGSGGGRESGKKPALLLGRYEVGKLLGQGNFAKVYHARNVHTGEEVAIKVTPGNGLDQIQIQLDFDT